jgi:hypothetical protein
MAYNLPISGGIEAVALPEEKDIPQPPHLEKVYDRSNWGLAARVDPGVTFEEYFYWAKIERALEIEDNKRYIEKNGPWTIGKALKNRFSHGIHEEARKEAAAATAAAHAESEKGGVVNDSPIVNDGTNQWGEVKEEEWRTAARALRTASWGTMFYLITTDILGWGGTP